MINKIAMDNRNVNIIQILNTFKKNIANIEETNGYVLLPEKYLKELRKTQPLSKEKNSNNIYVYNRSRNLEYYYII